MLVRAQSENSQKYQIHIRKVENSIKLDGVLDDADWKKSDTTTPFINAQPTDGVPATDQTEVRILFDEKNIYIGAKCWQKKEKYVVQSLRRDYPGGTTDIFGVNFDAFKDRQNAANFTVSPYNIQREGLISNTSDLNTDWDNRWFSKVANYDDYWTVEIAIPFKSLRYRQAEGQNEWLVNFTRFDQGLPMTERSSWAAIPRQFTGNNINFSGLLIWDTPPPKPGNNIALIPYVLAGSDKDILSQKTAQQQFSFGADAKVAITSSLNLDLTYNPDFAQVEVDKQQTNLSRFELLFPERRQFFIENSDLFGTFGFDVANPFFSRRIGLAKGKNGVDSRVPILAGARMTGRLNKQWRIGILDLQTKEDRDLNIPATNFLATAVQRKVLKHSNIGFIFANKYNLDFDTVAASPKPIFNKFNRVAGLDFNYLSNDNRWQSKVYYHQSFSPNTLDKAFSAAIRNVYKSKMLNFDNTAMVIGDGFNAETGYVPRKNIYRLFPTWNYVKWVEGKKILSYGVGQEGDFYWRLSDHKFADYFFSPAVLKLDLQSGTKITLTPIRWEYTYLFKAFDPTNTNGKQLAQGTSYTYPSLRFTYNSNTRKAFSYLFTGRFGQYFNGKINSLTATFSYRYQPYGIFSLDVNYNQINLPEGYNDRKLWLIGPRFDFSFYRNLFMTTFVQYNNQVNNLNLNARLQWRFAPVSDLFIVYTSNYFAQDDLPNQYTALQPKNKAVLLKCTYWLNQ